MHGRCVRAHLTHGWLSHHPMTADNLGHLQPSIMKITLEGINLSNLAQRKCKQMEAAVATGNSRSSTS